MKKQRKAQITTEVILGIGIIMFLFFLIAVFTLNKSIELKETEESIEMRNECLKIANLVNSVYISGSGTQVATSSDYLITIFNTSQISVEKIENITQDDIEKIAFLASESGATTEEFYNQVNTTMDPDPDWYKTCFTGSGLGNSNCDTTPWIDTNIQNDISVLMSNLDNYTTIYLEDPSIHYTTDYIEKLQNWTARGNSLILSEHVMCRDQSGSFTQNDYRCDSPESNNDVWNIFNVTLYQKDKDLYFYPFGNWNVQINDSHEAFDLTIGEVLSFEEISYILNSNANGFLTIGRYKKSVLLGNSREKPAILTWNYGDGVIYYFGDFQVIPTDFSDVIINLIEVAYDISVETVPNSDFTCAISTSARYQKATGDFLIKNVGNSIYFENGTL